ncbi:unnamed protein product [Arctogadus glacialis]
MGGHKSRFDSCLCVDACTQTGDRNRTRPWTLLCPSPSCSTALEQQYAVKGFKSSTMEPCSSTLLSELHSGALFLHTPLRAPQWSPVPPHSSQSSTMEPCSSTLLSELHSGALFLHTPLRAPQWSPVPPHSSQSSTVEPCSCTLLLEPHSGTLFLHTPLRAPQWSPVPPHSS